MSKKKKSSASKKKRVPVEIFGILYIILTVLGLLRSGFIGEMVSNFGIFLFGNVDILLNNFTIDNFSCIRFFDFFVFWFFNNIDIHL